MLRRKSLAAVGPFDFSFKEAAKLSFIFGDRCSSRVSPPRSRGIVELGKILVAGIFRSRDFSFIHTYPWRPPPFTIRAQCIASTDGADKRRRKSAHRRIRGLDRLQELQQDRVVRRAGPTIVRLSSHRRDPLRLASRRL